MKSTRGGGGGGGGGEQTKNHLGENYGLIFNNHTFQKSCGFFYITLGTFKISVTCECVKLW